MLILFFASVGATGVVTTPTQQVIGAGSRRGAHGGFELYAAMQDAERQRKRATEAVRVLQMVSPSSVDEDSLPVVTLPEVFRRVTRIGPLELYDETPEKVASLAAALTPQPLVVEAPVVVESEPVVYAEGSLEALRDRAQRIRDGQAERELRRALALHALDARIENARLNLSERRLWLVGAASPLPEHAVGAVALEQATQLAEQQRQALEDEELTMVLLLAA